MEVAKTVLRPYLRIELNEHLLYELEHLKQNTKLFQFDVRYNTLKVI